MVKIELSRPPDADACWKMPNLILRGAVAVVDPREQPNVYKQYARRHGSPSRHGNSHPTSTSPLAFVGDSASAGSRATNLLVGSGAILLRSSEKSGGLTGVSFLDVTAVSVCLATGPPSSLSSSFLRSGLIIAFSKSAQIRWSFAQL